MLIHIAVIILHTSILSIPGEGDAGGMNVYVMESIESLIDLYPDIIIDIITLTDNKHLHNPLPWKQNINIYSIFLNPMPKKEDLYLSIESIYQNLLIQIDPRKYQVIYSHYWISGLLAMKLNKNFNIPFVQCMHTTALSKNKNNNYEKESISRIQNESLVLQEASIIIVNTKYEKKDIIEDYSINNEKKIIVLSPGFNKKLFHCQDFTYQKKDIFTILYVGRIQTYKGILTLLEAIIELHQQNKINKEWRVLIVGGPSGNNGDILYKKLNDRIQDYKLENIISFISSQSRENMIHLYRKADIVCIPSFSESFCFVAVEAQACGIPVLSSKSGGLLLTVCGIHIDSRDHKIWADTIYDIYRDDEKRIELSKKAILHVEQFSWIQHTQSLMKIFHQIIPKQKVIMLIHAHPDDESIENGGTIAYYSSLHVKIVVIICTNGQRGKIIPPSLRNENIIELRKQELERAMKELNVFHYINLGYKDSGTHSPESGSFCTLDVNVVAKRLDALIRQIQPTVLITYNHNGGYGHPDHLHTHRCVMLAYEMSKNNIEPWEVPKVYTNTFNYNTRNLEATTRIDINNHVNCKIRAMKAYCSQIIMKEDSQCFQLSENGEIYKIENYEEYILLKGIQGGSGMETDVFSNINS